MINETFKKGIITKNVVEFNSISEFYDYICNTPINESFRWEEHQSSSKEDNIWSGTKSFEEAVNLLQNGWSEMANKLTQKLKATKITNAFEKGYKNKLDVVGYQPIVPLYLQGVPTNMMNKKQVLIKQKVVTLTKSISYNCGYTTEKIVEESIKALKIVQKLESQGYRVNLNIISCLKDKKGYNFYVKVRIKNSSQKLNIKQVAFPLVHPSMLRRLFFRFIEVYPTIPKTYNVSYGYPNTNVNDIKETALKENEYYIPEKIDVDIDKIKDISDLVAQLNK